MTLRNVIIQNQFPGIEDENVTIDFILDGLRYQKEYIQVTQILRPTPVLTGLSNTSDKTLALLMQAYYAQQPSIASSSTNANYVLNTRTRGARGGPNRLNPMPTTSALRRRTNAPVTRSNTNYQPPPSLDLRKIPSPPSHRGKWCTFHGSTTHDTKDCLHSATPLLNSSNCVYNLHHTPLHSRHIIYNTSNCHQTVKTTIPDQ